MEYHNLIIKFLAGEISGKEMILLKSWLDLKPENRRIFNEENEIWQEASIHTQLEHFKTDGAWINISSKLGLGRNNRRAITVLGKNKMRGYIAAAAVAFLMVIGSLSLWIGEKTSFKRIMDTATIVGTNEGEKAHIFLPDSSEIILNSGSSVQYYGYYNSRDRTIKLTGEAFFNVRTNPGKPFIVKIDQISIYATGTKFNVFSFSNEDRVETTLEEGIIHVSIKGKDPIDVKSGQQVVYFKNSNKVVVRDVTTDTYTSWKENKLRFNDTPFEEVLRRIGRKYNVKFEITNRDLLSLKYTATFIDESIEEVMQMLKTVSPITYKIYNRTTVNDKLYLKPRIIVGKRKT